MADPTAEATAVRVALWRAMHVLVDPPPHVLDDELGLALADPGEAWQRRRDMEPRSTGRSRACIVARARFIEDLVEEQIALGVDQYVILGAGLDTFAQRRPELLSHLRVFEVDRPGPQAWKRRRLADLGLDLPEQLRFVPVDFEADASWFEELRSADFDTDRPAVVASSGVSMYLTKETTEATLRQVAALAPGTTMVMTFMFPIELVEPEEQGALRGAAKGAAAGGTPFISFFTPAEALATARQAGFRASQPVLAAQLSARYFADRTDGLHPSSAEALLVAMT